MVLCTSFVQRQMDLRNRTHVDSPVDLEWLTTTTQNPGFRLLAFLFLCFDLSPLFSFLWSSSGLRGVLLPSRSPNGEADRASRWYKQASLSSFDLSISESSTSTVCRPRGVEWVAMTVYRRPRPVIFCMFRPISLTEPCRPCAQFCGDR